MRKLLIKTMFLSSSVSMAFGATNAFAKSPVILPTGTTLISDIQSKIENTMIEDLNAQKEAMKDESVLEQVDESMRLDYIAEDGMAVLTNKQELEKEDIIDEEIINKIDATYITEESIIYGYKNMGIADTDDYLEIKTKATDDSFTLGKMLDSNVCEILEEENGFYKIKSGSVEGYVKKDKILTSKEANIKATETMEEVLFVKSENLFVYNDIYMNERIMKLNKGDQITYLEKIDDKYKVAIDSVEGYIYVSEDVELRYTLPTAILLYTTVEKTQMDMVEFAIQFVGNPYVWGGTSLTKGADCSGFVQSIYKEFGITINRTARAQAKQGQEVSYEEMQPGDLIFYDHGSGSIDHVGMYIGNNQVLHASNKRDGIKISKANYIRPVLIKRILNIENTSY